MSLENIDFQSMVHQLVMELVENWKQMGFTEDQIQEHGGKFFEMGATAAGLIQQEPGIQAEGLPEPIMYTEDIARKVIRYFLVGLNAAAIKGLEQKIPSVDKWHLIQASALHVFEQAKQAIVVTYGQESTPEVQIPDDQIYGWLSQTANEAFMYYVTEHEKQHGPFATGEEQQLGMALPEEPGAMPELPAEEAPQEQPQPQPAEAMPEPVAAMSAPMGPARPSDVQHKYAAVGLMLSTLPDAHGKRILAAFQPDEQSHIMRYRDPDAIMAEQMDLTLVAQYVRSFKGKLGDMQDKPTKPQKSPYASSLTKVVQLLPPRRVERLFQNERPLVRGYVTQFTQPSHDPNLEPYELPDGVQESLLLYLKRNFPDITQYTKSSQ